MLDVSREMAGMEISLRSIGLGDLLGLDVLGIQLLVLAATTALFVLSLAMVVMAARAAGNARRARQEAERHLRTVQDVAVEARQLSAQIDRAMARKAAEHDAAAPIRVSARETTAEAEVEIIGKKRTDAASARNLEAVRESATVPNRLIGRSPRR